MKQDKTKYLKPYKSSWNNSQGTKTIRVPVIFAEKVLDYARSLDDGNVEYDKTKKVYEYLRNIEEKIKSKEKGYISNNSGKMIREIIELYEDN